MKIKPLPIKHLFGFKISMPLMLFAILSLSSVYGKGIDVYLERMFMLQPGKTISGIVIDSTTKVPIPGVSIVVKGTKISQTTDVNGAYSIQVPYEDAVLTFSFIGYQPEEVSLRGRNSVNVALVEDTKALQEVVVVGYTTQKKENLVGAVSTITSKDLVQSPTANINNMLAGRLPGLIANQYSGGEPGVDRSEIFIRGKATYGDQSPIVIIDGIERDMSYLAPDEIETFTILKDASSTAPFGIRGANGVIVITTKRGKADDKATVDFRSSVGINSPTKLPSLLGSADYATLYNEALINDATRDGTNIGSLNLFSDDAINTFRNAQGDNSDGLGYSWDYLDYLFKPGLQQESNLSIRGGNDIARYFVMGGYMSQGTNYDHIDLSDYNTSAKFKRYNFRSNIDVNITKRLWAKLNLGARITDRTAPGTSANRLMTIAMTQPPYLPIIVEPNDNPDNANYILNNPKGMLYGDQIYRFNMLGELTRTGFHVDKNTYLEGSFSMGYDLDFITKGLKVDGVFSYDAREQQWVRRQVGTYSEGYRVYPGYAIFLPAEGRDIYMTPGHYEGAYIPGSRYNMDQNLGNEFSQSNPFNRTFYQGRLNYNRTFADIHTVSGMLLFNRSSQSAYDGGRAEVDFRYQGLTGQFTYNYDQRYLAEFNFGYNGSENFAEDRRYGFFPAGALGWVVSREKFMKDTKAWLDFLKIRGSFGLVGSDKLPNNRRFGYLQFYTGGSGYSFGDQNFNVGLGGLREDLLANPAITWEKARKINLGLDAAMLKNRLNITVDFFHEHRYDILTDLSPDYRLGFPSVVGQNAPYINIGEVDNKGIDFELGWSDMIGKDFHYFVKPNFTFARNKIVFQNEISWEYPWRSRTGHRLDEFMVYEFDRFVRDQADADALNAQGYQPWGQLIPGDVVYKDLNGDGVITDVADRRIMGNPRSPEIQFGLPITLQYKGVDFSLLFQGALNSSILLTDGAIWDFPQFDQDKTGAVRPIHLNRWTPATAETATYPALHIGAHNNNKNGNSSLFLYDAKYLRLKNLEIGYNLPRQWVQKIGFNQIRFYAQGQNLITWDGLDEVDLDPETGSSSGYWYPILKVYNFGVSVNF
ncbi:SusC/RagA family TonB-linked outer membrane protein [Olivibacter sitiensis]|uniref:SusC/RagA family TonB-linked outer membrane protein n=1 Tax=Olivibacter sitiensis TaxID=376470 RepID=UPI0004012535|nr:TonB-dependent receptor [Olivibacter sitiensis]